MAFIRYLIINLTLFLTFFSNQLVYVDNLAIRDNCEANCVNGYCDNENKCRCLPNFTSDKCDSLCSTYGDFGPNCSLSCSSLPQDNCKCSIVGNVKKECIDVCNCLRNSCGPGLISKNCSIPCRNGYYGINCLDKCNCYESNTESCDKKTGDCRCKESYYGIFCESECKDGFLKCDTKQRCICLGKSFNDTNLRTENASTTANQEKEKSTVNEVVEPDYLLAIILLVLFVLIVIPFFVLCKRYNCSSLIINLNSAKSNLKLRSAVRKTPKSLELNEQADLNKKQDVRGSLDSLDSDDSRNLD